MYLGYKKGQLSVDFYIALVVFLGFLAYITFQLFQTVPASSANLKEESIRIEAYQISELLVNDGGHPLNWETRPLAEIRRIGLSDSTKNITNNLFRSKVSQLNTICSTPTGYNDVKQKLDVKDEISITLIEHTLPIDTTWVCRSSAPSNKKTSFNVSRTVLIGGTSYPTEIIVEVWRK